MTAALVGRGPVLAITLAALDEAMLGGGELLLVSGEPGIGKTAMLAELARQATGRGMRVLRGRCPDGGGAPAYGPWSAVLRGAAQLLPELDLGPARRLLEDAPRVTDEDPAGARAQLLDSVGHVLAEVASTAPLLVSFDDLHWADDSSIHLLDYLAGRLGAEPVVFVGSHDAAVVRPALETLIARTRHVVLAGLSSRDVRDLMTVVAAARGMGPPPETLATQVWRRSNGNPFFVRELTRLFVARGAWTGTSSDADERGALPDSIKDTVERHLARLSGPSVDLLSVAAVAGEDVDEALLGRVVGRKHPASARTALLAEAVDAEVLLAPGEPLAPHRFSHHLYRETLAAAMKPAPRRALHLAVARALDAAGAPPAHVALHLLASDTPEARSDMASVLGEAAADALGRLGFEEACRQYEAAVAACADEPAQQVAFLLGLAGARAGMGDKDQARADLLRAVELARSTGDGTGLARAAVALHDLAPAGDLELLTEASAAVPAGTTTLRARVLTALVESIRDHRPVDRDGLVAVAQEAAEVARAVGEPSALADALFALHDALWSPGTGGLRIAVLEELRVAAAAAGNDDLLVRAHQLRAAALLESGDPQGRAELTHAIGHVATTGKAHGRWEAMTRRATLALIGGRWVEADRLAAEAWELGRAIDIPEAAGVYGTVRGAVLVFGGVTGGFDMSAERLEESAPTASYLPVLHALTLLSRGEEAGARRALTGFDVDDMEIACDLEPLAALAAVVAAAGSEEQRRRLYERLTPYAGLHVIVGGCTSYWGVVDHHLARLAAALGRNLEAVVHYEAAVAAYDRIGAVAWAVLCNEALDTLG